jgi:hypothetical protein
MYREALSLRRILLGDDHFDVAFSMEVLGQVVADQARLGEADSLYREAEPLLIEGFTTLKEKRGPEHSNTIHAFDRIKLLYDAWGKPEMAEPYRL